MSQSSSELDATKTAASTTPEKKITGWDIDLFGTTYGDDSCGNCVDAHTFMKEAKKTSGYNIHYSNIDMASTTVKKMIEEKGITAKPYIKACPIYDDDTTDSNSCKEYKSWDPKDWTFLMEVKKKS